MNDLEILMKADAKKKAIEDDTKAQIQEEEFKKARTWKKETLEKLSFLKDYGCEFDIYYNSKSAIYITPKGRATIEIRLSSKYESSITKYDLNKPLQINWNYEICGGSKSNLSLEEFVKSLVRRGMININA